MTMTGALEVRMRLVSAIGGEPIPLTNSLHIIGRNDVYESLRAVLHHDACDGAISRHHVRITTVQACPQHRLLIEAIGQNPISLRCATGGENLLHRHTPPAAVAPGDTVCLRPCHGQFPGDSRYEYTLEASTADNPGGDSISSRKRPRESTASNAASDAAATSAASSSATFDAASASAAVTADAAPDELRFRVGNAYLNLLPGEVPSPLHVGWSDLLPIDCEAALFTSLFPEGTYRWLRSVSPRLRRALVIADRIPKPAGHPKPKLWRPDHDGWQLLEGQRSAGTVHASLLLFRTPRFLRIVCGGTNLEGQINKDRDSLFVQDVPIVDDPRVAAEDHEAFGSPLHAFLHYLAITYSPIGKDGQVRENEGLSARDQCSVRDYGDELIEGADFFAVTAGLVTCTPGGAQGPGGYLMLQQALRAINAPRLANSRIDIATGHFGHLQLSFLGAMARTLRRQEEPSARSEWADVGKVFMYHSSRATVLEPGTNCLAVMRTTAPATDADPTLLSSYFHDAIPKFERLQTAPAGTLTPILHGKACLVTAADGTAGVFVVGSQNFSKTSWGQERTPLVKGEKPKNVELGVVIKACTREGVRELRARFPIALAPDAAFATPATERGYVVARGPTDGDNSPTGLQFRWRSRCNDLNNVLAFRLFLSRWWKICSRCRAADVPCALSVAAIESHAWAGTPFLCAACQAAA